MWGVAIIGVFLIRAMLKRTQKVSERKKHRKEIREIANRPETKILKNTEQLMQKNEAKLGQVLGILEKTLKKHEELGLKLTGSVKAIHQRIDDRNN